MIATIKDAETRLNAAIAAEREAMRQLEKAAAIPPTSTFRPVALKHAAIRYARAQANLVDAGKALFALVELDDEVLS